MWKCWELYPEERPDFEQLELKVEILISKNL
jgi:hypothetical protein